MTLKRTLAAAPGEEIQHVDLDAGEITAREAEETAFAALLDNAEILAQIQAIEATITPRRIREAILGTDAGWLEDQEDAIVVLRAQLT